jgi:hypothetical protein
MSAEENKAIARREMEELFNHTGNLDVADEIYAPDYVGHEARNPKAYTESRAPGNSPSRFAAPFPTSPAL